MHRIDRRRKRAAWKVALANIRIRFDTENCLLFIVSWGLNTKRRNRALWMTYRTYSVHNLWLQILTRALLDHFLCHLDLRYHGKVSLRALLAAQVLLSDHFDNMLFIASVILTACSGLVKHLRNLYRPCCCLSFCIINCLVLRLNFRRVLLCRGLLFLFRQ